MRKKKIKIPLYYGTLIIMQVYNWDAVNKRFGFDLTNSYSAMVHRIFTDSGHREYYAVFNCTLEKATPDIIAHEVVHLVNRVFIDTGINPDLENDEPQAYLTGWFMDQICNFLYNKK